MIEGVKLLQQIKEGKISKELVDFLEVGQKRLSPLEKKLLGAIIEENLGGRTPKLAQLGRILKRSNTIVYQVATRLKQKGLISDFTLPELIVVYGDVKFTLPPRLDAATGYDRKEFSARGSSRSWKKKLLDGRAIQYPRYYIALIKKDGEPVFSNIFYSDDLEFKV
ncbi:MAG: hypothetical protein OH339_00590 [Candidatus Parvarchaeota archaeon]|nr:hypothetical protein [Candidatus Haiyanarchaeum thermophilum]